MNLEKLYAEKDITVCVTGHRDISLTPTDEDSKKLIRVFIGLIEALYKKGKRRFVSGGADGVDNLFAFAVNVVKQKHPDIENVIAIPFKEQYKFIFWNKNRPEEVNKVWCDFYWHIMNISDKKLYVDEYPQYKINGAIIGKFNSSKFFERNKFMVDISSCVIDVFRGEVADKAVGPRSGTKHCINYAIKQNRILIHMNPELNYKKVYILPN